MAIGTGAWHAQSILVTLQIEILVTVTSDFLKQMIILKSFSSRLGKNWLSGSIFSLLRNLFKIKSIIYSVK